MNVIGQADFKNRTFTPDQKEEVTRMIAEYIKSELLGGAVSKPTFINRVKITSNNDSRLDFDLAESYVTKSELTDLLSNCIAKKENKAQRYRSKENVDKLWLLIAIDDVSSFSGWNLKKANLPIIEQSNFDRVFIFEKFGCKVHVLYEKDSDNSFNI